MPTPPCVTHPSTYSHRVEVEVWSHSVSGSLSQSPSMVEAVRVVTAVTGRQAPLPEWTQLGAIVGLEGGTANVSAIVESLYSAGVPLAGKVARSKHLATVLPIPRHRTLGSQCSCSCSCSFRCLAAGLGGSAAQLGWGSADLELGAQQ